MLIYLSVISIIFLFLNYQIIINDIFYKKIPNKYLLKILILLPFFYIFLIINNVIIWYQFFSQIIIATLTSFILYYYWIWSAWDAKYLLVLSLFIPNIWIIPFISNIAFITLIYLFWYFIYFYFIKITRDTNYLKLLYNEVKKDNKDKLKTFLQDNELKIFKKNNIKIIINWILMFLVIFVWIRLIRLLIINWIISWDRIGFFWEIIKKYHIYIWIIFWIIYIVIKLLYIFIINKLKKYYEKFSKVKISKNNSLFPLILFLLLLIVIIYEYIINPTEIKVFLIKAFTIYLWIYIFFKILFYSYKITFQIGEQYVIDINLLENWDIVDKNYLNKMFWEQVCLWYCNIENEDRKIINKMKNKILFPNPSKYFINIDNPIDIETKEKLKLIYKIINKYHKKNDSNYKDNNKIKILKTFAFAQYIFIWFLITLFFQDNIFRYSSIMIIEIVKNFFK